MRVRERGVIFRADDAPDDSRSCAFSSLIRLADGSLVVAFRNATGRDSADGRLRIMRTPDEGRTWETLHSGLTATVGGVHGNLYSGYFTERSPGRLLGSFLWVDRSDPSRSFVNPQTAGILPTRMLLSESRDGGAHWLPFREIESAPHVGCAGTGPVRRLPDDVQALPYESWKEYHDPSPGSHGAHLRLSSDRGRTWKAFVTVASDPNERYLYWDQRLACHPDSGGLVALFWTHDRRSGRDLDVHIAWGTPDGTSWTAPAPTGIPGQHCQPVAVGGDRLVAVYVHRQDPPSLRVVRSEDFGRSWDRSTELAFYVSRPGTEPGTEAPREFADYWQDMMAWRFGHPRAVLLPGGDLFVAYYAGYAAATSMHWARIAL